MRSNKISIAALEMIQQLKALPATPDHLNPILVARMNEGEMTLTGCPLTSVHMYSHKINEDIIIIIKTLLLVRM